MVKINLLPWREALRKKKQIDFFIALGLTLLAVIIMVVVIHVYIDRLVAYQNQRNQILTDEIVLLDKNIVSIKNIEVKKQKLLAKIGLIQQLQRSRPEIVHLFDEIPKLTPQGVYLKKITQTNNSIIFEGNSESNANIPAFMKAIEDSAWFDFPVLEVIKSTNSTTSGEASDFILRAEQSYKEQHITSGKE
ncbi:MAG: PilN domain-containing protein [Methylovulum sp.]|jgi:type IV pilus assembly protein PilN